MFIGYFFYIQGPIIDWDLIIDYLVELLKTDNTRFSFTKTDPVVSPIPFFNI